MRSIKYIFPVVLSLGLFAGCSEKPVVIVQAAQGEQVVTAKSGKLFSIQLKGQMSTGYSWKLAEIPASMEVVKENVISEEKDLAGGIDTQEFVFKSSAKGDFVLTFRYGEHWKKKPKYVKTSTVKVRID
jgi:predicted secreted protein